MTVLEVLKDKKQGTILYSPCFGNMIFNQIDTYSKSILATNFKNTFCEAFLPDGRNKNEKGAEVMLFPSSIMRDWNKFSWKEGDILQHDNGMQCVRFIEYETSEEKSANYTTFKGEYILPKEMKGKTDSFITLCFSSVKHYNPFDRVLFLDGDNIYHIGIVEKHTKENCVYLMNRSSWFSLSEVFPYKDEMESLIGKNENNETKQKLGEILENGK